MSPIVPLVLAGLLLVLPLVIRPRPRAEMGEFHGFLALLWRINDAYCRWYHRLRTDRSTIPDAGPAILIANHTCNIDHCLLQAGTFRKLGFLIAKEYYDFPLFRPFCRMIGCIPVNRDGRDLAAMRAALRALEAGRVVPMFPEGRITPNSGESIAEGRHGVAFLAQKAKVPVIPAYIRGTPRANEFFWSLVTPSRARVVYGPPIGPEDYLPKPRTDLDDREALSSITERFMDAIRDLKRHEERRR